MTLIRPRPVPELENCLEDMMTMIPLLIITLMILPVLASNTSDMNRPLVDHPLHKGWLCHSIIGVMGLFLNSLVIVILFLERNTLVSSINVMIM